MAEDHDPIWKALSDRTRRAILDMLRQGPKQTTEIVENFPDSDPARGDEAYRRAANRRTDQHPRRGTAANQFDKCRPDPADIRALVESLFRAVVGNFAPLKG